MYQPSSNTDMQYYYAPPAASTEEPPKREFSKKDGVMALWMLAIGFLFVRLFVMQSGIATTLFVLLFIGFAVWYIRANGGMKTVTSWIWATVTAVLGLSFTLRAGSFGFHLFVLLCAVLFVAAGFSNPKPFVRRRIILDSVSAGIVRPFSRFGRAPAAVVSGIRNNGKKQWLWALLGIGIAIPLTVIILSLLSEADEGFEAILSSIRDWIPEEIFGLSGENVVSAMLTFPVACYLFGLLYAHKERPQGLKISAKAYDAMHVIPNVLAYTVLTPVCLIYPLFFFSQLPQYFAAFQQILPEGFVYSSYARQGFFELCTVSLINLILITVSHFFVRSRKAARIYNAILSVFTLMLLATAARKMVLYMDIYGLTVNRLLTCFFMAFLAVVFIAILLKQFIRRIPVASVAFTVGLLLIGLWQFGGIDQTIAEYNISRYESGELTIGKSVDFLDDLSYGAVPAAARLLDHPDQDIRQLTAQYLQGWYMELNSLSPLDFNIDAQMATECLDELIEDGKLQVFPRDYF